VAGHQRGGLTGTSPLHEYSVVRPMRAAHAPEDFYLDRITLPALAYGASMSGITVKAVVRTKVPSPRAWEHTTTFHR